MEGAYAGPDVRARRVGAKGAKSAKETPSALSALYHRMCFPAHDRFAFGKSDRK